MQTAAEYSWKTGCGREECKAQSVVNTHSDGANGEIVSESWMRVQLTSHSHHDANTHTLSKHSLNTHITMLTFTLTLTIR